MSYCPSCGKEVPADSAFCPSCGVNLTAVTVPPSVVEVPISYQVQTAAIPFDERASRIELFVRIVWGWLIGIVSVVYGFCFGIIILVYSIIAAVLNIINFLKILITAKRWKTAFNWEAKLIQKSVTYSARLTNYTMRRAPYLGLMIDRRPNLGMEPKPSTTPGGSPA
ncbi:MAG: zinc-ribbon domain-containing protein [Candidatus Bathyarchaeia archaeon]